MVLFVVLASVLPASAEPQIAINPAPTIWLAPTPMTRSDAYERLSFLVGTWMLRGFEAEGDFRDTCDWFGGGRRHLVCHATWTAPSGPREGLSVFSYRGTDGVYVYQGFRASGAVEVLVGEVSDDGRVFEFKGEDGSGSAFTLTRVAIQVNADGSIEFKEQTKTGELGTGTWTPETIVTYVRAPVRR